MCPLMGGLWRILVEWEPLDLGVNWHITLLMGTAMR
jgi:hypothetical protein